MPVVSNKIHLKSLFLIITSGELFFLMLRTWATPLTPLTFSFSRFKKPPLCCYNKQEDFVQQYVSSNTVNRFDRYVSFFCYFRTRQSTVFFDYCSHNSNRSVVCSSNRFPAFVVFFNTFDNVIFQFWYTRLDSKQWRVSWHDPRISKQLL